MLSFHFFSPFSFVDESIYCTNIGRALERLKQYRLGLITTVNVPQTWSTDRRVFICTINTNTCNPRPAVWRSAFPSQRRSLNCGLSANTQHLALQYSCDGFLIFTALDLTQLSLRILIALAFSKPFLRWLFEKHIEESKC